MLDAWFDGIGDGERHFELEKTRKVDFHIPFARNDRVVCSDCGLNGVFVRDMSSVIIHRGAAVFNILRDGEDIIVPIQDRDTLVCSIDVDFGHVDKVGSGQVRIFGVVKSRILKGAFVHLELEFCRATTGRRIVE